MSRPIRPGTATNKHRAESSRCPISATCTTDIVKHGQMWAQNRVVIINTKTAKYSMNASVEVENCFLKFILHSLFTNEYYMYGMSTQNCRTL